MASDDFHVMGGLVASDDLGVPLDCILHQQSGWGGASDELLIASFISNVDGAVPLMTADCFSDQVRTRIRWGGTTWCERSCSVKTWSR